MTEPATTKDGDHTKTLRWVRYKRRNAHKSETPTEGGEARRQPCPQVTGIISKELQLAARGLIDDFVDADLRPYARAAIVEEGVNEHGRWYRRWQLAYDDDESQKEAE